MVSNAFSSVNQANTVLIDLRGDKLIRFKSMIKFEWVFGILDLLLTSKSCEWRFAYATESSLDRGLESVDIYSHLMLHD